MQGFANFCALVHYEQLQTIITVIMKIAMHYPIYV
jgi:hypothetical protein